MDRAQDCRRGEDRRNLPRASGTAVGCARGSGSSAASSRNGCTATIPRNCSMKTAGWSRSCARSPPKGRRRMGANPHANGGKLVTISLDIPSFADYAIPHESARFRAGQNRPGRSARCCATFSNATRRQGNFRLFCPDETNSNRLGDVFEVENRCLVSNHAARRRSRLARRTCDGSAERAFAAGMARRLHADRPPRLFATYEAFAMIVDSMVTQHAKWLKTCVTELPWRKPIPSLNYLLTSTCWRNDHNGFSHQGPGFIDTWSPSRV